MNKVLSLSNFLSWSVSGLVVTMLLGDFRIGFFPWGASYYVFSSYPDGLTIFLTQSYVLILLLLPQLEKKRVIHIQSPIVKYITLLFILVALAYCYRNGGYSLWHAVYMPTAYDATASIYSHWIIRVFIYMIFITYLSWSCRVFGLNFSSVLILNGSNMIITSMVLIDVMPRIT